MMKWGLIAAVSVALVLAGMGSGHPETFKWQETSVQIWASQYTDMSAICSGAWVEISGKPYVLTAAHCVALSETSALMVTRDRKNFEELTLVRMGWKKTQGQAGEQGGATSSRIVRPHGKPLQGEQVFMGWDMSGGDWAVLSAKSSVRPAGMITKAKPQTGQQLWTYTYPLGLDRVLTVGITMNPSYRIPGTPFDNFIATDLKVWKGSSGSVVYAGDGVAVGVVSALIEGAQIALIAPLDKVSVE